MKTTVLRNTSLKRESDFLRITQDSQVWYGGDQAWFDFTVGQYGGCGTVAAANMTAYLAGAYAQLHGLYGQPDLQRESFLKHMNILYEWVRPWKVPFVNRNKKPWRSFGWTVGLWPTVRFARGVERFAHSRGICLRGRRINSRSSLEETAEFIRESLERDCPVAMLIGVRPRYEREQVQRPDGVRWQQTHFSMHWVVITMLTKQEETFMVKVSTWGGYSWLDLKPWHEAGGLLPGLVSFIWNEDVRNIV